MSVQFGKCNFDGRPLDPKDLDQVRPVLAPYGPDGEGYICKDNFGLIYRAFHTTKESRKEKQPHLSPCGFVLTWDGRLDNREELIGELRNDLSQQFTDVDIVAAAYQCWGTDSFAKLIGDWALSIWEPKDRTLILAKDPVGTRFLYYKLDKDEVTWCTILDPLVLMGNGRPFKLEEEYVAGWLAFFPATHLTPYSGIRAVPPSSFVRLVPGSQRVCRYWDFDPEQRIRYRTDGEYEEHFLAVFSESVRRRLHSDGIILAQLSGGMDSSAIVCVGDDLFARGQVEARALETVSYYDSSEPNWDERPYFTEVDRKRGREGHHIPICGDRDLLLTQENERLPLIPSAFSSSVELKLRAHILSRGYRVMLSGTGGDEVTGGVPTPVPELSDLLAAWELRMLARQLRNWALWKRKPWLFLLAETLRVFLPLQVSPPRRYQQPPVWLRPQFIRRNREALRGYDRRIRLTGPLPSFQENLKTLDALRRQLACSVVDPFCEERYPYLDRDFLQFLFRIPREQLVRPGQRRSLMRRALIGLVPDLILQRRRKAFVSRRPILLLGSLSADFDRMGSFADALGCIDSQKLAGVLQQAQRGEEVAVVTIIRTLLLEFWLRQVTQQGVFGDLSEHLVSAERCKNQFLERL